MTASIAAGDLFLLNLANREGFAPTLFQQNCFHAALIVLGILLLLPFLFIFLAYGSFRYRYCDFPVDGVQADIDQKRAELSHFFSGPLLEKRVERKKAVPWMESIHGTAFCSQNYQRTALTASNSSQMSCAGEAVARETATIATQATRKAGSSS